ncbi:hypothetical protein GEMRC1_011985 [Eukaryota sp. GEM-RC1]
MDSTSKSYIQLSTLDSELQTVCGDLADAINALQESYDPQSYNTITETITELRDVGRELLQRALSFVHDLTAMRLTSEPGAKNTIMNNRNSHLISEILSTARHFYGTESSYRDYMDWAESHNKHVFGDYGVSAGALVFGTFQQEKIEVVIDRNLSVQRINEELEELNVLMLTLSNLVANQNFKPLETLSSMMVRDCADAVKDITSDEIVPEDEKRIDVYSDSVMAGHLWMGFGKNCKVRKVCLCFLFFDTLKYIKDHDLSPSPFFRSEFLHLVYALLDCLPLVFILFVLGSKAGQKPGYSPILR